jgi:hypothetical protein
MKAHYLKRNTIVVISYNANRTVEISASERLCAQLINSGYNLVETSVGINTHTLKYMKQ